jgi:hypothetical protein
VLLYLKYPQPLALVAAIKLRDRRTRVDTTRHMTSLISRILGTSNHTSGAVHEVGAANRASPEAAGARRAWRASQSLRAGSANGTATEAEFRSSLPRQSSAFWPGPKLRSFGGLELASFGRALSSVSRYDCSH